MGKGWICLHRKMLDWEWFSDPSVAHLFIYLLLAANYEDKKWHGILVPKGSLITSRAHLSAETGLSEKQVRTALNKLVSTGEVASKTTNKYTLLTVNNYSLYQDRGQQEANKGPTKGQQEANKGPQLNKETKKQSNKETNTPLPPLGDVPPKAAAPSRRGLVSKYTSNPRLRETLEEFITFRKRIGKPANGKQIEMLLDRLSELATDDDGKIAIVNQSLMNGWNGFFPLSGNRDPEPKSVPDWYGDTGENDEMDPALLEKALRIQRELQEEKEAWRNLNETKDAIPF